MQQYFFAAIGIVMAVSAIRLVTTKNVVHGALYLLVVLAGTAGLFVILLAEFLAWVQVLIYVGAVVVLILFGLMLTRAPIGRTALDNENRSAAAAVASAVFIMTSVVMWRAFDGKEISFADGFTTEGLATQLFTRFVLPFEVVSVLLLAALVGAVLLARKEN
jgi:NADH-quinone oxidoreductase subunit J